MQIARVHSLWGLGDNIYLRPLIRTLTEKYNYEIFTDTPWPELFCDIPGVSFVKVTRPLRTQLKNRDRQAETIWKPEPKANVEFRPFYTFSGTRLFQELVGRFKLPQTTYYLDLPHVKEGWPRPAPIALVRPVTVRKEWYNAARNPLPDYISTLSDMLMKNGYHVICVADIDGNIETLVGNMPRAHEYFTHGMPLDDLLSLIQASSVLVGGPGWIIPASIAADKPGIIVFGGQKLHNSPEVLIEPYWPHKLRFLIPDNFHACNSMRCPKCDKRILNFSAKAQACLDDLRAMGT